MFAICARFAIASTPFNATADLNQLTDLVYTALAYILTVASAKHNEPQKCLQFTRMMTGFTIQYWHILLKRTF